MTACHFVVPNALNTRETQEIGQMKGGNLKQTMGRGVKCLKHWTRKRNATIIYDSTVDRFTADGIFEKVKGKENIAVIAFTTDGDVFGGYYNVAVTKQGKSFYDPDMFLFSLQSHGRCKTPQQFVVDKWMKKESHVAFWKTEHCGFVVFRVKFESGCLLGNDRLDSVCVKMSKGFKGLEDTTLTGQNSTWDGPYFHCARLIAIQFFN